MADLSPNGDVPSLALETVRPLIEHALTTEDVDLTSPEGRQQTEEIIDREVAAYHAQTLNGGGGGDEQLSQVAREALARALRDDFIGLGALAERMLTDPQAQEWMINSPRRVFRDDGQRLERVHDIRFADDRQVRSFLDRLLERVEGRRLDRITPMIEARLPDGSRLTAAIPPVSSNGHVICSIRRFRLAANTLPELTRLGFLSEQASEFLGAAVRARKNIVVAGPVSAGKTTLLNALGHAIPGAERVVVCESSAELKLPELLSNCVGYEARHQTNEGLAAITLEKLVSEALRMNPQRLIVGECRGPETMAMLWGLATGHAGMTSVHGESAEHAITNLARFALTSGENIEATQVLEWLRDVDLVIHCERPRAHQDSDGHFLPRRIDRIVEVAGIEGHRMTLNPLFTGTGAQLQWAGTGPAWLPDLQAAGYTAP